MSYVLGHSPQELERLAKLGAFLHDLTRNVFIRAGITSGMHVLDFGAGMGDVSVVLAELVGPSGRVLALDRSEDALAQARQRCAGLGVDNIEFHLGDEHSLTSEHSFDAVAGRLVLLHQPDTTATIVKLAEHLRPGGVVALQEVEIDAGCWASPPLPLLEQALGWITDTLSRGGMPTDISARMETGFRAAGLADICVMREGRIERGADSGAYDSLARMVRTMLPLIERLGEVSVEHIDVDTLADRMRDEAVAADARFIPYHFASGWARRPSELTG